ncbi:MAG: carbohydrate-binding family 9-like protein [Candidatus Krumholzibacteriota bacterium]|nr:carbohydrate-binding family 9-like protein [Candidatus Krumholzibacteriota bacterium]
MKRRKSTLFFFIALAATAAVLAGCSNEKPQERNNRVSDEEFPCPSIEYSPKRYICRFSDAPLVIDGKIDDPAWLQPWTEWTHDFADIEGEEKTFNGSRTRAKMMWDDHYFYIAIEIVEPAVWATVTRRDGDVYMDNDVEIYIDPDGDTHEYYELGINAFGTVRDIFMVKPYRDGGPALLSWDIEGLESAVHVDGTINDPGNRDRGWTVEVAIPWAVLGESAHKKVPPDDGDIWAVNLSRANYDLVTEDGKYVKSTDAETAMAVPERLTSWSAQGISNMHYPEMWGLVKFSVMTGFHGSQSFRPGSDEQARWLLRKIYYSERSSYIQYGSYTSDLSALKIDPAEIFGYIWPPAVFVTPHDFEAVLVSVDEDRAISISADGRVSEFVK